MVRAVLFDLDDTLFDHHRSAGAALARVHERFAGSVAFEQFEAHHIRYLEEMHIEVLAGRVDLDEARRERFRRVFAALGLEMDDEAVAGAASAYRSGYLAERRAMDGAAELLAALAPRVRIGIVSNNLLDEQREKLEFCALAPYVDALVVSGEVGISKPDPGIFHIALERLGVSAGEAVMVGDSWAADIVGARRAGIRAIWFNPWRHPRPTDPADADVLEIGSLVPAGRVVPLLLQNEPVNG
jgi:YjjG family noncanonical pyrimidine nucleotidase